jgi:hypothetical protein
MHWHFKSSKLSQCLGKGAAGGGTAVTNMIERRRCEACRRHLTHGTRLHVPILFRMMGGRHWQLQRHQHVVTMAAREAPAPLSLADPHPSSPPSPASASSSKSSRSSSVCGEEDIGSYSVDDTGTDASSSAHDASSRPSTAGGHGNRGYTTGGLTTAVLDVAMAGRRECAEKDACVPRSLRVVPCQCSYDCSNVPQPPSGILAGKDHSRKIKYRYDLLLHIASLRLLAAAAAASAFV